MNRQEFIKSVANDCGLKQKDVGKMFKSMEYIFADTLEKGEEIRLTGFLSAKPIGRDARVGRHPGTGESVKIPKKVGVFLNPGKSMKDAVAGLKYEDYQK